MLRACYSSLSLFLSPPLFSGPLYFSPKCRKNVYRVYHHTRDCTIPACKQLWGTRSPAPTSTRPGRVKKKTYHRLFSPFFLSSDFKRCARLLTRLAGSPQCTEG